MDQQQPPQQPPQQPQAGNPAPMPQPTPVAAPAQSLPNQNAPQGKSKSMYLIMGIIVVILIVGGVSLFFMSHHAAPAQPMMAQKTAATPAPAITGVPTPVISPVTAQNVDQTLTNTDNQMQQAVNQANSDLNSISTINSSQDSTSGL